MRLKAFGSQMTFYTPSRSPTLGQGRAQSQSSYRGYRSILSTSLDYVNSLTKGFAPWRPVAEWGTVMGPVWGVGSLDHTLSEPDRAASPTAFLRGVAYRTHQSKPLSSCSVFLCLHSGSPTLEGCPVPGTPEVLGKVLRLAFGQNAVLFALALWPLAVWWAEGNGCAWPSEEEKTALRSW